MSADTAPVRTGEELDREALLRYLRGRVPGIEDDLEVEQFPGGHSNLTYLVRAGGREYVLRRAPLGPVAPKAHDMVREARVLIAVHPHFPPAPAVYHVCEDPSIIGAAFFLMERRRGVILRESVPPEITAIPDHPRQISEAMIDTLVQLHAVDIDALGLGSLGKPEGFLERQVRGWADRWQRARTESAPEMDQVLEWIASRLPESGRPTLVHNDYKLDNVMLDPQHPDRISAVLDWEMATVGDPLSDLGLALCYWWWVADPEMRAGGIPAITASPGWYTRDEFVERYARATGRDVSLLSWHEIFGVFKLAVIIQQIYYRYLRGQTNDPRFGTFDQRVRRLIRTARDLVERAG